ncbi:MAG TPA: carboxypeptidase-like regulatory domain-containing protein [Cyclobacteriaceae bacterium]|nr:carboxypeptidase-like regulatory domain-containing protein [Cyclobacteriaceae bacterium]
MYCVISPLRFVVVIVLPVAFQLVNSAAAQTYLSGQITNNKGAGIPGVNVWVVGTSTQTSSDLEGGFQIPASPGNVIAFTHLGYKSRRILVGDETALNVSDLEETITIIITGL